jgi:4-diphosphocytidyl-2-C-methyl-D-erythritol kinase
VHDVVTLVPGAPDGVTVAGPFASYIGGENLLMRALSLLRETDPRLRLGSVRLDKHLPVAAGLGGGSADAAALLRAVGRASPEFSACLPWAAMAARLGADVPVCLQSKPALMRGIGEKIAPVQQLPETHAVLVNPGVPLATADVFRSLEAPPLGTTLAAAAEPPLLTGLSQLLGYMRMRGNDLEQPATRLLPVIAEVREALEAEPGCLIAAMAGSGPTCFGIFAGRTQTRRAADRLAEAHEGWWVRAVVLQGS